MHAPPFLPARSWNATMKHHSSDHSFWVLRIPLLLLLVIIIFLFLFLRTPTASRLLPPTRPAGRDSDHKPARVLQASQVGEEEREDTWDLMGMEVCEDGNEECLKRRVISEAHLDYIYTQRHHKP